MATQRILRFHYADFICTASTPAVVWSLLGLGVVKLDETPSAQVDNTTDVNNRNSSPSVSGYQNKFPFDFKRVDGDAAQDAIYDIGRDQKTGTDAELDYLRVDTWGGTTTTRPARKFRICVETANIQGAGGQPVHVDGTMHQVGDFVEGTYNETTGAFTAAT